MANELVTVGVKNWLAIRGEGSPLHKPFSRKIFLWDGWLAETSMLTREQFAVLGLKGGEQLELRRVTSNPYVGKLGVRVSYGQNAVGWLPFGVSDIVAHLMDEGKRFSAKFTESRLLGGKWVPVGIELHLEEA